MAVQKLKPEDPETEGLVPTTREDALELMNEIIEVWQPSHQSWLLNNSAKVAGIFATLPAIYLSLRMRRMFGLDKVSKMTDGFMYLPGLASAGAPAYAAHSLYVRDDIVLQESDCSVCVDVRSAAIQVSSSLILPSILTYGSAIMHASRNNLRLVPKSLKGFVMLSKGVYSKLFVPLCALTIMELLVSEGLVRKQYTDRVVLMGELERRYTLEQQRLQINENQF